MVKAERYVQRLGTSENRLRLVYSAIVRNHHDSFISVSLTDFLKEYAERFGVPLSGI